ncbi:MAG: SufS family cysteine desulfurase [Terriglobia bacterium]
MSAARDLSLRAVRAAPPLSFDVSRIREDFPVLKQKVHGKPLVYLDNAATSQKPQVVLDALHRFYAADCSNVHRGVHQLSERATKDYEESRSTLQCFINAADHREIVFVRGTSEAINLVAQSYGRSHVCAGNEILITAMEHHSNIVPWQILCEEKGARLRVAPINDAGELLLDEFEKLLNDRTRFVSVAHVSNALGTINPVRQIIEMAHRWKVPVLLDGAQAAPHLPVDVQELDCEFYAFSSHKLYGPTGIGVLYGKASLLEAMAPYQSGGEMISSVTFEKTLYKNPPYRFEAGTPNIAGTIGFAAAIDYVNQIGLKRIGAYEHELLAYATQVLSQIPGVRLIGTAKHKAGILSFIVEGVHAHDVGTILDLEGVAVRTGHHCAQPTMARFGVPATARVSLAFYNTREEVDVLVAGIRKVTEVFG